MMKSTDMVVLLVRWRSALAGVLALSISLTVSCLPVFGANLSDSQMYFDPELVPLDHYPRIYLNFTGSQASYAWPQNDIQNVQMLPLLKPYSTGDPAGYPIGYSFSQANYDFVPNQDYFVDLTNGVATATFNQPGVYHALIDRPGTANDQIYSLMVDSDMLDETLGNSSTSASVRINGPTADLVVASQTGNDPAEEKGAANAMDDGQTVTRAANMAQAVAQMQAASQAAGRKIHVELIAHGAPGVLQIGNTIIGGQGGPTIAQFQAQIDPFVNNLSLYACNFAQGQAGMDALQTLANSIGRASGFTVPVSVHRAFFGFSRGWDLSLRGTNLTLVPEPASATLAMAFVVLALVRRRR
jgi:hypothetical protein